MPKVVDHEARRRDFIEAAYQTILDQGLARTTVRAVAQRAGYTTGALVHYFADKDELIRHVLEENGKLVRERMERVQLELSGRAALRALLLEALPTDARKGSSWRIWLAMWYHSEESDDMRQEEKSRYREWTGRIRKALQQARADGDLPQGADIGREAMILVALIDGIGIQFLMSSGRMSARRITQLLDIHLERLFCSSA